MTDETREAVSITDSYKSLEETAAYLNFCRDALSQVVEEFEHGISKLNLGVSAWVTIAYKENEWEKAVGYTKVGGKWGIAIRVVKGLGSKDGGKREEEVCKYKDASTDLRLASIVRFPDLLIALSRRVVETARLAEKRVTEVRELVETLDIGEVRG